MSSGAKTPLLMAPGMLSSKCTVDSGTGESRAWEVPPQRVDMEEEPDGTSLGKA